MTRPTHTASPIAQPRRADNETAAQLVFFGEDWGRHPSTAQYLARELLVDHEVTWINSIGLREPSLSRADLQRVVGKIQRALPGATKAPDDPAAQPDEAAQPGQAAQPGDSDAVPHHMLSPWIAPWHRFGAAQAVNKRLFNRQIAAMSQLQAHPYSVVTANPASYYLLDELSPRSSLYYCADKYAHIAGLNPGLVERFERALLERVDAVAATSLPLVDDLSAHHNNVHYLPHGVDFARFNATLALPEERTAGAKPVVGFVGLLGEHIDFELIADCASALADVEFLFVGPVEQGIKLPQATNISYVGKVPQQELPAQLQKMQVCTLPYAMTQRNHYANPTKVREYLAAGRSVVATQQPGLADIAGDVSIAPTTTQFIAALQTQLQALEGLDSAALREHRRRIAEPMQQETWAARAHQLVQWL